MLATAAVVVVTLPVTASNFHVVSIAGIVLNTILSVPVIVAILSGFLLCLFGSITILGVLIERVQIELLPVYGYVMSGS